MKGLPICLNNLIICLNEVKPFECFVDRLLTVHYRCVFPIRMVSRIGNPFKWINKIAKQMNKIVEQIGKSFEWIC